MVKNKFPITIQYVNDANDLEGFDGSLEDDSEFRPFLEGKGFTYQGDIDRSDSDAGEFGVHMVVSCWERGHTEMIIVRNDEYHEYIYFFTK